MAGKTHKDFKDLIFPGDEQGRGASVLVGLIPNVDGPGEYKEIDFDPLNGQLRVQVVGGSGSNVPFTHGDGTPEAALIDGQRRQVVVEVLNTPNFVLMHDGITAANVEFTVPIAPQGYTAIGARQLIVDIDIATPGDSVRLQPVVWNPLFSRYVKGAPSPLITESKRVVLQIHSPEDVYLMPIEVNGTVSVAVAGI